MTHLRVLVSPNVLRGIGLDDIVLGSTSYSDTAPPWALNPGENVRDNIPAGVPVYNVTSYTTSKDIYTCLNAVDTNVTTPGYAYFPAGVYTLSTLQLVATNDWRGWTNSSRRVMGFIGDGADQTFWVEGAGMIPTAARTYALAPTDATTPVPLQNIYVSNSSSTVPIFISGITFKGQFQTPYGVPASSGMSVNVGVNSPIPHRGIALWRTIAGSRVQYCRFQGFAFSEKQSPPYELGNLETNYDNGLVVTRCELDGREASGAVSAGGFMPNYTSRLTWTNSWIHDTRRSGFAIHEHGGGDTGQYTFSNVQIERISKTTDSFEGSSLGFPATNIEEVSGTLNYTGMRMALDFTSHFTVATTAGGPVAQAINVTDCVSLSSTYNGCLVIRIVKTPNSSGTNPYWNLFNTSGLGALPFHFTKSGVTLTPVASTSFNSTVHFPDRYYVVITS